MPIDAVPGKWLARSFSETLLGIGTLVVAEQSSPENCFQRSLLPCITRGWLTHATHWESWRGKRLAIIAYPDFMDAGKGRLASALDYAQPALRLCIQKLSHSYPPLPTSQAAAAPVKGAQTSSSRRRSR